MTKKLLTFLTIVVSMLLLCSTTFSFNTRTAKKSTGAHRLVRMPLKGISFQIDASDPAFFNKKIRGARSKT